MASYIENLYSKTQFPKKNNDGVICNISLYDVNSIDNSVVDIKVCFDYKNKDVDFRKCLLMSEIIDKFNNE